MQNFILVDDFDSVIQSHPLTMGIQLYFNKSFSSVSDLIDTPSLADVANNNSSHDQYIIGNIFKKVEDDLGLDPEGRLLQVTLDHLKSSHQKELVFKRLLIDKPVNIMMILNKARATCHRILQEFNAWEVRPRLTPGATEDVCRSSDVVTRMRNSNERSLDPLGNALKHWYLSQIPTLDVTQTSSTNDGSYVAFASAPKTLKITRPIGYHEPIQLAVQCGTGDLFSQLLTKHTGIDISKAQDWHRFLVEFYSTEPGTIATMDQSDASQNILREHAKYLLPTHVWKHLDAITPQKIKIGDKLHSLCMLAAQGNGFIFPLQTIIFYSLIHACMDSREQKKMVYQYGDDSIFPAEKFSLVKNFFSKIGFTINEAKSFTGDVLESCGADFHDGINIRPFHVKKIPTNHVDWYHVCNGIYRVGCLNNGNTWRSSSFKRLWLWCISHIPANLRFFGPVAYGDDVITSLDVSKYTLNESGTRITTLGTELKSGVSFATLWSKIPANDVSRFCIHPSFSRAGLRHRTPGEIKTLAKRLKKQIDDIPAYVYPAVLGPREVKNIITSVGYPVPLVKRNSELDETFKSLCLDSDRLLSIYEKRRQYYISVVLRQLKDVSRRFSEIVVEDLELS